MKCKICGSEVIKKFAARIMNKYDITYFRCPDCGFIQTEEPYWLKESYANDAISVFDTGVLSRNRCLSELASVVIYFLHNPKGQFLDYGGGYGILARLMRDRGFDFYWNDPFAENIFARGFEGEVDESRKYEVVTAFENFEHFVDPVHELEKLAKIADTIILSTELLPEGVPSPAEWWYYGLDHGQHVSLYSYESLKRLAGRFQLNVYSNRRNFHVFTKRNYSDLQFYFLTKGSSRGLAHFAKLSSLTLGDVARLRV